MDTMRKKEKGEMRQRDDPVLGPKDGEMNE